jgi:agarase
VTTSLSSGDSTPDSFGFNTITGAALSSGYISNAITITGIDTSSMISITNGLYSIDGGTYT